jgi:predicted MFS family arabinose efflux permease
MLFGYIGIWSIITQGFITKPVAKKFNPGQVLRVTIMVLALLFPLILLVPNYYLLYAVVLFIPMMNGLTMPNLTAVVSGLADAKGQGKVLGVNQSVMAVSQFLSPLIGGYLVGINYTMPIWVTFVFILAAWFAFIPCYNRHCAG